MATSSLVGWRKRPGFEYQQEWFAFGRRHYAEMPEATCNYMYNLRRFADAAQASTVLEIGVGPEAVSALAFAYSAAVKKVVSIEIDPSLPGEVFREAIRDRVEWDLVYGDSCETVITDAVELLYIDGAKDNTLTDFERYYGNVKQGGFIVIDDFPCYMGVRQARTELETRGVHFVDLPYDGTMNGHLIWRKS